MNAVAMRVPRLAFVMGTNARLFLKVRIFTVGTVLSLDFSPLEIVLSPMRVPCASRERHRAVQVAVTLQAGYCRWPAARGRRISSNESSSRPIPNCIDEEANGTQGRRRPVRELGWTETDRTRIGERTISRGEKSSERIVPNGDKPKLDAHLGMVQIPNASSGTAVASRVYRKRRIDHGKRQIG
jgi:hypothetical protein